MLSPLGGVSAQKCKNPDFTDFKRGNVMKYLFVCSLSYETI